MRSVDLYSDEVLLYLECMEYEEDYSEGRNVLEASGVEVAISGKDMGGADQQDLRGAEEVKKPSREQLAHLYYDEWGSTRNIAKFFNVSGTTVLRWLKKYQLKVRTISEAKKGCIPWNKGLTKETDPRVKKYSDAKIGRKHPHTQETKNKISKTVKRLGLIRYIWNSGKPVWNRQERVEINCKCCGKTFIVPLWRTKHQGGAKYCSQRCRRLNQILPKRDTSIEIKMQNELLKRNINFETHTPLLGILQPDIIIRESKIAIFCDGDYWHNRQEVKERDIFQTMMLAANDWYVMRFWEHEINENVKECADKIEEIIPKRRVILIG